MINFLKSKLGIATVAYHKLGDISRNEPDYCVIQSEDELNYYGHWLEGFGFIDVRFPKGTTRIASDDLKKKVDSIRIVIRSPRSFDIGG